MDADGELINHDAKIGFVGRVVSAFYDNCDDIDVDDWERETEHGFFHIDCFIESIPSMQDRRAYNFLATALSVVCSEYMKWKNEEITERAALDAIDKTIRQASRYVLKIENMRQNARENK